MIGWIKRLFGAQQKQKTSGIDVTKKNKNSSQPAITASDNSSVTIGTLKSRGYSTVVRTDRNASVRINGGDIDMDLDPVEVSRPTPSYSARTSNHNTCSSSHAHDTVTASHHSSNSHHSHSYECHSSHSDSGSWGSSDSGSSDSSWSSD